MNLETEAGAGLQRPMNSLLKNKDFIVDHMHSLRSLRKERPVIKIPGLER